MTSLSGEQVTGPAASVTPQQVVVRVLGQHDLREPDPGQPLVAVGATSLVAMAVREALGRECGLRVPLTVLLGETPLDDALQQALTVGGASPFHGATEDGTEDGQHCDEDLTEPTPGQRGMWTAERVVGGQLYGLVFTAQLDGPLNPRALHEAVAWVTARHDGLRTRFVHDRDQLRRVVEPHWTPPWEERVAPERFAEPDAFRRWATDTADAAARTSGDLDAAPPLRFLLLSAGPERHALCLLTHHLLLDAWAVGLLLEETLARYRHLVGGPRPALGEPVPAATQAALHRKARERGELAEQLAWWLDRLAGVDPVVQLPSRRTRPEQRSGVGRRLPFTIDAATSARVHSTTMAWEVTPFALLFTAFAQEIGARAGRDRLIVGVPVAGRSSTPLARLVAQCARVLPVVVDLDPGADPASTVRAVHRRLLAAQEHDEVTLEQLAPRLAPQGDGARNPLVQMVCGDYSHVLPWRAAVGPLQVAITEGHAGGSPMDVTVAFTRAPERDAACLGGTLEFATDALSRREALDLIDGYLGRIGALASVVG